MVVKKDKVPDGENINQEREKQPVTYTKEQILVSEKYKSRRDLVNAILLDGKRYTTEVVDKKIEAFMKGTVK